MRRRKMYCIAWTYETEQEIMEDTDVIVAYSEEDAFGIFCRTGDIPEQAHIVEITQEELEV